MMTTITVTSKRQLVLPSDFCAHARISPGSQLRAVVVGNGLYLSPIPPPTEDELKAVIRAANGPFTKEPPAAAKKVSRAIQAVRRRTR